MKFSLMLAVVFLSLSSRMLAVPETIRLADGRTLEKVTAAEMERDKLRVAHASGVSRHAPSDLAPESLKALGIASPLSVPIPDGYPLALPAETFPKLWTVEGKHFDNVRSVELVNPSEARFTHDAGTAIVRLDQLEKESRTHFRYDPAKSKAYDEAVAEVALRKAELQAKESALAFKISELEERLLAKQAERKRLEDEAESARQSKKKERLVETALDEFYYQKGLRTNYGEARGLMIYQREQMEQRERALREAADAKFRASKP